MYIVFMILYNDILLNIILLLVLYKDFNARQRRLRRDNKKYIYEQIVNFTGDMFLFSVSLVISRLSHIYYNIFILYLIIIPVAKR